MQTPMVPTTPSLRIRWRRWRGYYKSRRLFRERLSRPWRALAYPIVDALRPARAELRKPADAVPIAFRSGRSTDFPLAQWPLLPVLCRLDAIGAETEILPDAKCVHLRGVHLYSPLWTRNEAEYYSEVFLEDIYGVAARSRQNMVVVDVGAYVGDSAVAFARAGAQVHAVEPADDLCRFIARNAAANRLQDRIVLHPVGLSDRAATVKEAHHTLNLVEGVAYTLERLPRDIDVLKLDCEGAEYHLLADERFLKHLRPREICMEFHQGPDRLLPALASAGYQVRAGPVHDRVGLLYATLANGQAARAA